MDRDLLSRVHELKNPSQMDRLDTVVDSIKDRIDDIKAIDTNQIVVQIQASLLPILNSQNGVSVDIKSSTVKAVDSLSEEIEEKLSKYADKSGKTLDTLTDVLKGLSKEVNAIEIPKTDLSSVEKSIKGIKPTSVKSLESKLDVLIKAVAAIKIESPKIDLSPVLDEIRKPRTKTVTFKLETDQWDFPTKVIATESYK